jgi:hypothetical protein
VFIQQAAVKEAITKNNIEERVSGLERKYLMDYKSVILGAG